MKLCKANVTKVLKRAGFRQKRWLWESGFAHHTTRAGVVYWSPDGLSASAVAGKPGIEKAMTSTLSPYWTVTPVEGGLQLSEKEG